MIRSRNALAAMALALLVQPTARGDLFAYVRAADPSYRWNQVDARTTDAGTVRFIDLTSQTWREIPWTHRLQVYEPAELTYPGAALLFITGGSRDSRPSADDVERGFALAKLCGARVAVLPQVPNQPLLDGRTEDDLIAETFVRYLETKDENWPLLFPMVKSAVRAMDAVQELAKRDGRPIDRFVVTGASKRGWTTWLTGAVDRRVAGIAPMVIPTLNMKAQNKHQLEVWGKYSEQIEDYTRRGLTEKVDTPEGSKLWRMIDPYSYLEHLTMPKLVINGTNDRYWTLDSLNVFWNDVKGPKWVVYLPNAGHGLQEHRDYAMNGVGAFFRSVVSGRPFADFTWQPYGEDEGKIGLTVTTKMLPKECIFWYADSQTHDFREVKWKTSGRVVPATARNPGDRPGGECTFGPCFVPEEGNYHAIFADLVYEIDGIEFHLSSLIRETGPKAAK